MNGSTMSEAFRLRGEYDLLNAAELERSLLQFAEGTAPDPITVDAGALGFMDSSGIGALLRVREVMEREGRPLRMVNVPVATLRVLEALDLTEILGVETS
jgi:anti-sigma B factor antagonist